jgi:hypothetical protein
MANVHFIYTDQLVRYDTNTEIANQTAQPLRNIWPSLPQEWSSCDAVLNMGRQKLIFFKGKKFVRYDILKGYVDHGNDDDNDAPGYHINKHFLGFPAHWEKVDAVVNYGNGRIYFFYQNAYARYDIYENRFDQPVKDTHSNWIGLPPHWENFDAALNYGNGKVYFFRDGMYVRYDMDIERVDQDIRFIADGWRGVSPSAIRVTAAFPVDHEAEKMGMLLEKELAYSAAGYAYCIYEGKRCVKFGTGGISRKTASAQGDIIEGFNLRTQFDLASMSKTLVAALAVKTLEKHNVPLDAKISSFFPKAWTIDQTTLVAQTTFRQLLTQTSGMIKDVPNGTYLAIKDHFLNPANFLQSGIGNQNYKNGNFAILRILLPIVAQTVTLYPSDKVVRKRVPGSTRLRSIDGAAENSAMTANAFVEMMKENLFRPFANGDIDTKFTSTNCSSMFRYFLNNNPSYSHDEIRTHDHILDSGCGGWKMSIMQLARTINAIATSSTIMSPQQTKTMFDNQLGCYRDPGSHILATHNGGITSEVFDGNGLLLRTGYGGSYEVFDNNIQCVVYINSCDIDHERMVRDAHRNVYHP